MRTPSSNSGLAAIVFFLFCWVTPGVSQSAGQEYPKVDKIVPVFKNFQSVSEQYVLGNVQLRSGMYYNPALIDQSVRALYGTGRFEFVEVKVEESENNLIDVLFELTAKYDIEAIEFNGNDSFSDKRLSNKLEISEEEELETGVPLDEYKVSLAADVLTEYYIKKGYPDVAIEYRIQRNDQTGYATVIYDIEEGQDAEIDRVKFEGNTAFSGRKLRRQLETKQHNFLLSWITGTGRFDDKKFEEDLDTLRKFYRDAGYLDSKIDEDDVEFYFRKKDQLHLIIKIEEGDLYYLGDIAIEDNTIYTTDELLRTLEIEPGQEFSPQRVDDAASAIRDYYTSNGYLESRVRAERVPNMDNRRIDIVFRVRESDKFYIESVKVEGNTKSKARVIIREIALRPGDVFDLKRMEVSEARLNNTSYFEDVRLSHEPTDIPGRKDLSITVREGRTGSFTFGAGFGSIESATVFFEVSQGNFDLFNWRSGFQGDGQKFRFRASIGTNSNQMSATWIEPWLFEQRLELGVELYRSESDFNSSDYDELRTGFEIFLRRRLFELVEGRLSYRFELVDIFDVVGTPGVDDPGVPNVFEEAEGEELVSKVGFTLLRDNRDSLLFARKGNRTTILNEYAGVGGDVHYYKFEAQTAQYIPTFDLFDQSISILARVGTATPLGDYDSVPFYDRFYLGGPKTLRGFDFRDIGGSLDDDLVRNESIGGQTYSMLSFEYMFRLAEPLGLVAFYDWGYVNAGDFDFNASKYADNWGIGARVLLMGSPLQLDYGIPITTPEGVDDGGQFQFSFGTRF